MHWYNILYTWSCATCNQKIIFNKAINNNAGVVIDTIHVM